MYAQNILLYIYILSLLSYITYYYHYHYILLSFLVSLYIYIIIIIINVCTTRPIFFPIASLSDARAPRSRLPPAQDLAGGELRLGRRHQTLGLADAQRTGPREWLVA